MKKKLLHIFSVRVLIFAAHALLYLTLAKLLTPQAFGAYNLAAITMFFISTVGSFSLQSYTFIKVPQQSEDESLVLFKSVWVMQTALSLLLLLFVCLGAGNFMVGLLRMRDYKGLFYAALFIGVLEFGVDHLFCFLRGRKKMKIANHLELAKHFTWIFSVLFCAWRQIHFDLLSIFIFIAISDSCILLMGLKASGFTNFFRVPFNLTLFKKAFYFGLPLTLSACVLFVSRYSDRYFLSAYHGLSQAGLYSFYFALSSVVYSLVAQAVFAVMPPYLIEADFQEDESKRNKIFTQILGISVISYLFMGSILLALIPHALPALFPQAYGRAARLIPFLLVGNLALLLSQAMQYVLLIEHRTKVIMRADLSAIALGVVFNVLLVPKYSLDGAVCTFVITSVFLLLVKTYFSRAWRMLTLRTENPSNAVPALNRNVI